MDWKPISTAPKDQLLLLWGHLDPHPESAYLHAQLDRPTRATGYWCDIDRAWALMGSTWLGPWFKPTLWQPLPPPPHNTDASGPSEGGER